MRDKIPDFPASKEQWRRITRTMVAPTAQDDRLFKHLDYLAKLMAEAGQLPRQPVLVWREAGFGVSHAAIGSRLVVGRDEGSAGLALPKDTLLSRQHFAVRM